jgi:hypothetical protein
MIERLVLLEGYHDRAFVQGLLEKCFECVEARDARPELKLKGKGVYKLQTLSGALISYVPVGSDDFSSTQQDIVPEVARRGLDTLITIHDADLEATSPFELGAQELSDKIAGHQSTLDQTFVGGIEKSRCRALLWSSPEGASDLLPPKQTLERLVCGAIHAAYPERLRDVRGFLDSRSAPLPQNQGKEEAMSLMAGWNANAGSDSFYRLIWNDDKICSALVKHLTTQGLWPHFEALAK